MTKTELLNWLAGELNRSLDTTGVQSADKIEGEDAVGVAMEDGTLYFLTLDDA